MLRQQEAFPRLDLVSAQAAMDRLAAAVCVFSIGKQMVGQLFLPEILDEFVKVNFVFSARHVQCAETETILRTVDAPNPLDPCRRFFICGTCSRRRRDLFYVNSWACSDCHHLLYRSQLIDKEVKLWEERDALHARLKKGRPKSMHNSTYFKHRLRLTQLEGRLHGRARKYASDEQNLIMEHRWVPPAEIDFWSSRYWVSAGNFVRRDH